MKEKGGIVNINDDIVTVKVSPSSACSNCQLCTKKVDGTYIIYTKNTGDLSLNQKIAIEIPENKMILYILLI